MRIRTVLIATATLMVAAGAGAAQKAVSVDQAMKAAVGGARAAALAEKSSGYLRAGDSGALAAHLRAMKADPQLDTAAREKLLYKTTLAVSGMDPDPALRDEVEALADYESQTLVWTDEHGHREIRPLYDVAAAARQTRRAWAEEDARKAVTPLLAKADASAIARYARGSASEREGIEQAFESAPTDQLAAQRETLATSLARGEPVGELAAVAALRTGDQALMYQVIAEAAPEIALHAVRRIDAGDWTGAPADLLEAAAVRPETASAALLALGRRAGTEPGATATLFATLGQPAGASAAAALARVGDDMIARELGRILAGSDDEIARRQALLGLRLMDSTAAEDELRAFAGDPRSPATLVREVPSWLRE
jgi:hypothetical protein